MMSEVAVISKATGIAHPTAGTSTPRDDVYTLDEVYLGTHVEGLPQGIYIAGDKKTVKN